LANAEFGNRSLRNVIVIGETTALNVHKAVLKELDEIACSIA